MQYKKNRQQGFAHVGLVVAIILVLAAIGFASWYVWNKTEDGKQTSNANNTSQTQNQREEEAQSDPSEGGKYLVIKEWGVRFLLSEELRGDVYYKTFTNALGEHGTVFASKRLDGLVGDGSCTFLPRPDGTAGASNLSATLSRLDPNSPGQFTLEYYRSQRVYLTKQGDYEYYYTKETKNPPITCLTGQHEEFNDVEQSISNQLKEAFTKLESVGQ